MTSMPRLYPVRRRLQPLVARGIPALFAVFALSLGSATAQQATVPPANPPDTTAAADTTSKPLTAQQLQSMVAPIALYPDDLLAQTLVASTYPLEIVQLQQWLAKNPKLKDQALADSVKKMPWDPSIQSMAQCPRWSSGSPTTSSDDRWGTPFSPSRKRSWTPSRRCGSRRRPRAHGVEREAEG
jgi:hypothetical protein